MSFAKLTHENQRLKVMLADTMLLLDRTRDELSDARAAVHK